MIGSCGFYPLDIDRTQLSDNVIISNNDRSQRREEKVLDLVTGSEGDSGSATWRASFGQQI